ncbi:MAG TPA: carbohydrate ABC transporter permease [Thermotogota bacterium]|nr:carbohydrate ABC transporter permease [Thermotogota bacterium]HRW92750.1 carbohydrate ABC transporter permease [Thermotogota bacterium]
MDWKTKLLIRRIISLVILSIFGLLAFIPLYWMVITAIKPATLTLQFPPELFPRNPTLQNFKDVFQRPMLFRWTFNSLFVAGAVTTLQLLLCSMAGYSLAKKKFPLGKLLFSIYIASMMIPRQVTLVPLYILVSKFSMIDTYWGLILPGVAAPFGVFLMRQFMVSIPSEIIEASRIDGASEWGTYFRIILPISKPALAVLGIFTFVGEWNNFLWPLIVTNTSKMKTLQAGLALLQEEVPMQHAFLMAGATYAAIPMIIIFFAFSRYFLKGVTVGAIK